MWVPDNVDERAEYVKGALDLLLDIQKIEAELEQKKRELRNRTARIRVWRHNEEADARAAADHEERRLHDEFFASEEVGEDAR